MSTSATSSLLSLLVHHTLLFQDLGYQGSEAYGISYKARGLCNDLSNLDIFNDYNGPNVRVEGDIDRSDLHHNVSTQRAALFYRIVLLLR